MKRILTLICALVLSIGVNAQTTLTEAVNFTATAHNGEEIDLFEILDEGQYVLINFYSISNPPAHTVIPRIVDAYYRLGCNQHDVYFMEVSPADNTAVTNTWIEDYGIEFPTIHTETAGTTGDEINEMYGVANWPTIILIAPDRSIKIQDMWPIESAQTIVDNLAYYDIEEHNCADGVEAKVSIDVEREASNEVDVTFVPNVSCSSFYFLISESAGLTEEEVKAQSEQHDPTEYEHTFTDLDPSTKYVVYSLAINAEGENGKMLRKEVNTLCQGGSGVASVELDVRVTNTHIIATANPNDEVSQYHFGFVRAGYYNESDENKYNFLYNLHNDNYPFCDQQTYEVEITENLLVNTEYYVVALSQNGDATWSSPDIKSFMIEKEVGNAEVTLSLNYTSTTVDIHAVPNEFAVEYHYGVAPKSAFDNVGEAAIVEEVRNDGEPANAEESKSWTNLTPDTEYYAIGTAKNAAGEWGTTTLIPFKTKGESIGEVESAFNIYPNPATSTINIKSAMNGEAQISIVDMTGRCVKEVVITDMSNATVNVEDLKNGVYFISVQQDNNYSIQKLVIE